MPTPPLSNNVDLLERARTRYIAPARASLLREINARQHALITAFGGPAQVFSGYLGAPSGSGTTFTTTVRCPPGASAARVGALVQGYGHGANESLVEFRTGTEDWVVLRPEETPGREAVQWRWTGTDPVDSQAESRLLLLRSTSPFSWANVVLQVRLTRVEVFAIALVPAFFNEP